MIILDLIGVVIIFVLVLGFASYVFCVGLVMLALFLTIGLFLWGGSLMASGHPFGIVPLLIGGAGCWYFFKNVKK